MGDTQTIFFLYIWCKSHTTKHIMKKKILGLALLLLSITVHAQNSSTYNYSIGLKALSVLQLPKIIDQNNAQDFNTAYANGFLIKFNDNQFSYRLNPNYYKKEIQFKNKTDESQDANGTVTDCSFKIGFEKNFNYSAVQPYFAFDVGYRSNNFKGSLKDVSNSATTTVNANKNGAVIAPGFGLKINLLNEFTLFAESSLDINYFYEKQEYMSQSSRTVTRYNKWEYLLNPVTLGFQINFGNK